MIEKVLILKAVDILVDLLKPVVESTDNELDDKVLEAVDTVKKEVDKVL